MLGVSTAFISGFISYKFICYFKIDTYILNENNLFYYLKIKGMSRKYLKYIYNYFSSKDYSDDIVKLHSNDNKTFSKIYRKSSCNNKCVFAKLFICNHENINDENLSKLHFNEEDFFIKNPEDLFEECSFKFINIIMEDENRVYEINLHNNELCKKYNWYLNNAEILCYNQIEFLTGINPSPNYIIKFLDNNCKLVTIKKDQYVKLGKNDYTIKTMNIY